MVVIAAMANMKPVIRIGHLMTTSALWVTQVYADYTLNTNPRNQNHVMYYSYKLQQKVHMSCFFLFKQSQLYKDPTMLSGSGL